MLIRKKLTEDEFSNPALRYSADCDCVQFSPDGGTTWIDQPSNDPRSSDAYRLPPLTGTNEKCRAAEGMTELIRLMVNARIEDISSAELAGTILGIVAFIPGFNVLWALILTFVALAFTIARELLEAAFTEPVYEQIRCIYFCNIDEDGQMSQEQFDAAYAALIDLDALARTWVQSVMNLVGAVGMSNAGVALEAAADCDECECAWCYTWLSGDGFSPAWTLTYGTYDGGNDRINGVHTNPVTGNTCLIQAKINFASTTITFYEVEFAVKSVSTAGGNSYAIGNGTVYGTNVFDIISPSPQNVETTYVLGGDSFPGALTDLWIQLGVPSLNSLATYNRVTKITIKGVGTNPFGETNCE